MSLEVRVGYRIELRLRTRIPCDWPHESRHLFKLLGLAQAYRFGANMANRGYDVVVDVDAEVWTLPKC